MSYTIVYFDPKFKEVPMKNLWLILFIFAAVTSTAFAENEATDTETVTTQNIVNPNPEAGAVSKEEAEAAAKEQPEHGKRNKWDFSDHKKTTKNKAEKTKKDKYERSTYDRGSFTKPRDEWVSQKNSSNYSTDKK